MYERILKLDSSKKSFFLWGQRQVGKTSLLKSRFPDALVIDLLKSDEFMEFSLHPYHLRERLSLAKPGSWVIIDEVQKVPQLLDEVHWLIENKKMKFGLCGSSARKLRKGHANLLGGRALRYELYGFSAWELKGDFSLKQALNAGYIPNHYLSSDYVPHLKSYVTDYLKEEILAEGLIRNLPQFSRFLEVASLCDSEILNYSNIGRECGVSPKTAQSYYEILADTLVGNFCPAYSRRPKRRTVQSPRFYFHDVGVVNSLIHRRDIDFKSEVFGKAFENWVFHELTCYNQYFQKDQNWSYWRLTTGVEVDFVLNSLELAIEVKGTERVTSDHLKGLREFKNEHPNIKQRVVVSLEKHSRKTEDGILILPYITFIEMLYEGELY